MLRRLTPFALGVRREAATGHLFYRVEGVRHYIRFREEAIRGRWRREAFEQIYFKRYLPAGDDVVVDIGAGLGTEIVRLARHSPELRYIAVEIQPWVYECLCLTLAQLPAGFAPFGLAISQSKLVGLSPTRQGEDVTIIHGGPVAVAAVTWSEFVDRHALGTIDLLKINVEGAEAELIEHIDLACVKRVIVNVHDFRADDGEDERFRTRDAVEQRLKTAGFQLQPVSPDWIFAERAQADG